MPPYIQYETVNLLLPEILLCGTAIVIFMAGAFTSSRAIAFWLSMGGLLISALALYQQDMQLGLFSGASVPDSGPIVVDLFGHATRWGVLALGALLVLLTSGRNTVGQVPEYLGSLLLLLGGMMIVAVSNELVLMFLGLELISIPTYVLLYLGRRDIGGQESTIKYFFLSILSSALLLYGFSFLYGVAGTTRLDDFRAALAEVQPGSSVLTIARLGMLLIFAGLGFRITAVPFHFYAPDVYQGTSHANAGILSTLPKLAGLMALIRIVAVNMPEMASLGWKLAIVLAILTMTVGNVLALWQDNLRRMMAYSSVAHGGYLLIGLAVTFGTLTVGGGERGLNGVGTILFYLVVYSLSTVGAFAALAYLGRDRFQVDGVDDLAGLSKTHSLTALSMAIFMFSLTGIPPLAGFWGKFALFTAALNVDTAPDTATGELRPWFIWLAIIGVVNAAISAAYYLRIVAVMYFRPPLATARAEGGRAPYLAMAVCAVLVVAAGLTPGRLMQSAVLAGQSAFEYDAPLQEPAAQAAASVEVVGSIP